MSSPTKDSQQTEMTNTNDETKRTSSSNSTRAVDKPAVSGIITRSHSRDSSINANLNDDALLVGTALDQLLENLDAGKHLSSPTATSPIMEKMDNPIVPERKESLESMKEEISRQLSKDMAISVDVSVDNKELPDEPPKSAETIVPSPVSKDDGESIYEDVAEAKSPILNKNQHQPDIDALPESSGSELGSIDEILRQPSTTLGVEPLLIQEPEQPLRKQPGTPAFMDIIANIQKGEIPLTSLQNASRKKRDTARSLLLTNRTSTLRASSTAASPIDEQSMNFDEIPDVSLPGFTARLDPGDQLELPESEKGSSTLNRGISWGRKPNVNHRDDESGVWRKRSLNDPSRSPNPRIHMVVAGGVTSKSTPGYIKAQKLARQTSVRRPKRSVVDDQPEMPKNTPWRMFSKCITCYALPWFLSKCGGMKNRNVQQAWREKMALVSIIFFMCLLLGFITFGFEYITCGLASTRVQRFPVHIFDSSVVNIRGDLYNITNWNHPGSRVQLYQVAGRDVSWMFPLDRAFLPNGVSACDNIPNTQPASISCTVDGAAGLRGHCHTVQEYDQMLGQLKSVGVQTFRWEDVSSGNKYMVYNGWVLNLDRYFSEGNRFLGGQDFEDLLVQYLGKDATRVFIRNDLLQKKMACLMERFRVGKLENDSAECFASQIFMWISLCTILGVILIRFFIALFFNCVQANSIGGTPPKDESLNIPSNLKRTVYMPAEPEYDVNEYYASDKSRSMSKSSLSIPKTSRFSSHYNMQNRFSLPAGYQPPSFGSAKKKKTQSANSTPRTSIDLAPAKLTGEEINLNGILRTIMLVTCYSEGEDSLKATLNSLAKTDFPDSHKLLFIIADGLITGSGNSRSTPDIVKDLITIDPQFEYPPTPHSYVAIADGKKRHNMAQVYAGRYLVDGHSVPTVLVVKCGTPEEQTDKKPGNRGKRDSQVLLMQFLSKVMFDERMTPLEFDLFTKMTAVSSGPHGIPLDYSAPKVTPDLYELVLMVDADTVVMPESLTAMSYAMANDPKLIGLCGETRIANKSASWVTAIQVFEYYISHFLSKSFESVFGSCTCLPGCFCMYRVKAPKPIDDGTGLQYFVPILASPDIVEAYSENKVDTLHKKNLYLLGEDRYLTTLILKTFPKRNLIFVPNAVCKTLVPETFQVLLSQRRRWINSTIHNLLELVMVRDLCGIFCFSMQFIIFMELIGTAVLPAAIAFTLYLIIISFFVTPPPLIPLFLLAAILGLPAILILIGNPRRWVYILWMCIYLISLPIWNFVLPVYAFWHFDDFTWGETRKLEGVKDDKAHGEKEGLFDPSKIVMKRWYEWEMIRRGKSF